MHLHGYYRERLGLRPGLCPATEAAFQHILSLPIHPAMGDAHAEEVIAAVPALAGEVP